LHRILAAAGFHDPQLRVYGYHSDALGLEAMAPLLDPAALAPLVESGALSPEELARAFASYRRFRADPDAFVLLTGFAAAARAPA
jgi:hypothetical protein